MQDILADLITNFDLILFVIVGIMVLLSAFLMLEAKNLAHSIIFLALAFAGVAIMYILMSAEFLAMIQMTVYTGGVIVLFLFALMLTRSEEFNLRGELHSGISALIALLVVSVFVLIVLPIFDLFVSQVNPFDEISNFPNGIAWVGFALFNYYQVGFIILGLIVVAALVGAIYIVKNEPDEDIRVVSPASGKEA